jgi:hypothetical protein
MNRLLQLLRGQATPSILSHSIDLKVRSTQTYYVTNSVTIVQHYLAYNHFNVTQKYYTSLNTQKYDSTSLNPQKTWHNITQPPKTWHNMSSEAHFSVKSAQINTILTFRQEFPCHMFYCSVYEQFKRFPPTCFAMQFLIFCLHIFMKIKWLPCQVEFIFILCEIRFCLLSYKYLIQCQQVLKICFLLSFRI